MKIRALQGIAGPDFNLKPGDEYEGDAVELARWCAAGVAVPVEETRRKAVARKPRKAVKE